MTDMVRKVRFDINPTLRFEGEERLSKWEPAHDDRVGIISLSGRLISASGNPWCPTDWQPFECPLFKGGFRIISSDGACRSQGAYTLHEDAYIKEEAPLPGRQPIPVVWHRVPSSCLIPIQPDAKWIDCDESVQESRYKPIAPNEALALHGLPPFLPPPKELQHADPIHLRMALTAVSLLSLDELRQLREAVNVAMYDKERAP